MCHMNFTGTIFKQTGSENTERTLNLANQRARDLGIISENAAARLLQRFRANGWHRHEPGEALPSERPLRMDRLIYRALAEDLISRSRAQELLRGLVGPLRHYKKMALQSVLVTDTNIWIDLENGRLGCLFTRYINGRNPANWRLASYRVSQHQWFISAWGVMAIG